MPGVREFETLSGRVLGKIIDCIRRSADARFHRKNILSAIEAGASGYILKDALTTSVASEIDVLLNGGSPLSPNVASLLLDRFRSLKTASTVLPTKGDPPIYLTKREAEILNFISKGCSYSEIASLTTTSVETVATHLRNVYTKLSVHNRSEAVYEATRLGLLPRAN